MEATHRIRKYENLHIVFWLIKDTCWMMEWRTMGLILIVPTIFISLFISYKTIKEDEFFINLAITFWIMANSYWMCCEFIGHVELKNYAAIPFTFGFIATAIFYWKRWKTPIQKQEAETLVKAKEEVLS